ncbi:hypothetical protein P280DRAFT_477729 [Massarina eburnea CBS 473.64]|uniref:4Fe-4S ferredoxin-type domain-containing protein n=1 Tax=Massarina eburnea CBS 473.64 TaxID=1395130 RepID=A0A6A6S9B5_9PLEO|nr:hypothetical protein P280DRAFT_477729 [Massarina eburnea CBS 473.64]
MAAVKLARSQKDKRRVIPTSSEGKLAGLYEEDGLWRCCCRTDHPLILWEGKHPFEPLKCTNCGHVMCAQCCSTDVITVFNKNDIGQNTQYKTSKTGKICPDCGQTHCNPNAGFGKVKCACGRTSDGSWVRFMIGSPHEHRTNPGLSFAVLDILRAKMAAKRCYEGTHPVFKDVNG